MATAIRVGSQGTTVAVYWPSAMAVSATGAAKPTVTDTKPASRPSAGCQVRASKWYSPPERGMAAASSA